MKKWGLLALLLFSVFDAEALELLCDGKTTLGGQVSDISIVFVLNEKTFSAETWTPEGQAVGVLETDIKNYRGLITAPNGNLFSVTLDRFSGDLFVIRVAPPAADSKAAFWGNCRRAERKF